MNNAVLISVVVMTALFIAEGLKGYRQANTLSSFFLMDGKLKTGPFVGTLASTNFSLGNMIYLSLIWGYFFGFSGTAWLWIGFVIAALVYLIFLRFPQVANYIEDSKNGGSVHEYLQVSFSSPESLVQGRHIRLAASAATIFCLLIALTLELFLAASLLGPLVNVDTKTIFFAITVLICFYSSLGGFQAVVVTDIIQGAFLLLSFVAMAAIVLSMNLPLHSYAEIHSIDLKGFLLAPGWPGIASILAVTIGWYLVSMDTWQRACSARSASVAARGLVFGNILLLLGILFLSSFGMFDRLALQYAVPEAKAALFSGGINPITDLYLFAETMAPWSQALLGFVGVGFVVAGLSTADTFLIVSAHSFVSDLLIGVGKHASFSEIDSRQSRFFTNIARAIIVGMAALVIGMYFLLEKIGLLGDPLGLFYLAYSIQFSLLAPVVASLWRRRPRADAVFYVLIASILSSIAWGFGFAIAGKSGVQSLFGLTTSELIYLAPVPPMLVGFALLIVAPKEAKAKIQ